MRPLHATRARVARPGLEVARWLTRIGRARLALVKPRAWQAHDRPDRMSGSAHRIEHFTWQTPAHAERALERRDPVFSPCSVPATLPGPVLEAGPAALSQNPIGNYRTQPTRAVRAVTMRALQRGTTTGCQTLRTRAAWMPHAERFISATSAGRLMRAAVSPGAWAAAILAGVVVGAPQHAWTTIHGQPPPPHPSPRAAAATVAKSGSLRSGRTIRAASSTAADSVTADGSAAPYSGPPRVCILGGGFGGLYTAIKLESLMWPRGVKPQVLAQLHAAAAHVRRCACQPAAPRHPSCTPAVLP